MEDVLTRQEWLEVSTPDMLKQMRTVGPPRKVEVCRSDAAWAKAYRAFCKKTLAEESLDFLDAVEKFDSQPSRALAQQICSKFVASSLINLPAPMQNALTPWFAPDTWAGACREVATVESQSTRDFRAAVDRLGSEPDLSSLSSPDIYDLYVGDKEMGVKLSDEIRRSLSEIFESRPGPHEAGFFGGAYAEITLMLNEDSYKRFKEEAGSVGPHLEADSRRSGNEAITPPARGTFGPQGQPAQASVNDWNKKALGAMRQGDSLDFYQVKNVVVIADPARGVPPGASWLQQQGALSGTITLTKKGGAFDAGSIEADDVSDEAAFDKTAFEAAIASVSKRRVEYA